MSKQKAILLKLFAEVLRLQRWAGGDIVSADRIYGLMHGFETVLNETTEEFGIPESTQELVEDILEDVEAGRQSPTGMAINSRLHRDRVDKSDAAKIMTLCRLQERFLEGIDAIMRADGCVFNDLMRPKLPENDWFGALHYMELIDCSDDERHKMHNVFAPSVPGVGDFITPEQGQTMEVIGVDHVMISQGTAEGSTVRYLVPHVLLKVVEEASDDELMD